MIKTHIFYIFLATIIFSCSNSTVKKNNTKGSFPLPKTKTNQYAKNIDFYSLEGEKIHLSSEERLEANILAIILPGRDTFCISDYTGLVDSVVVKKNFIVFNYSIRGGSGVSLEKSTVICVSKDRIFNSLEFHSLEKDIILGSRLQDSIITVKEIKIDPTDLMKNGSIELTKSVVEKWNGKAQKNDIYKTHLIFDSTEKIFYNKSIVMEGRFYINNSSPRYIAINGKLNSVLLKTDTCLRIDMIWYIKRGNELLEITENCNYQ